MKKVRRITAVAAAAMALIGMSTLAAAPAGAAVKKGPQPVTQLLGSVDAHDSEWVHVKFKTDRKVCKFKLRVLDTKKIDVSYPYGWSYTSLKANSTLSKGEVDYVSFRVTAHVNKTKYVPLGAKISYTYCGWDDEVHTKTYGFVLPVEA